MNNAVGNRKNPVRTIHASGTAGNFQTPCANPVCPARQIITADNAVSVAPNPNRSSRVTSTSTGFQFNTCALNASSRCPTVTSPEWEQAHHQIPDAEQVDVHHRVHQAEDDDQPFDYRV